MRPPYPLLAAALLLIVALALPATAGELVVLQYHFVGEDTPRATTTTTEEFRRHLEIIAEEGFTVVDLVDGLDAALALDDASAPRGPGRVAITFDDGYRNVHENAFPLLAERGWPFTVFVNPAAVDAGGALHAGWDELRTMQAAGARIANHGQHHAFLVRPAQDERGAGRSAAERFEAEIAPAQARIAERLGTAPRLFAYPYGEYDDALRAWLEERGYRAFGQHSGVVSEHADPQALPRFPLGGRYAEETAFREKLLTGALPVLANPAAPDPTSATQAPSPSLQLVLDARPLRRDTLACYGPEGRLATELNDLPGDRLALVVAAREPLPLGRSRFNCTARDETGRWLWYSQPWLRLGPDGRAPP